MEEKDLIKAAKKGNQRAFAILLQQNYTFVKHYLLKITLHPSLAEDITQETMIKSIEKIHQYNGKAKFSSWLITIASNLYIDELRKQKRKTKWLQNQGVHQLLYENAHNNDEWVEVIEGLTKLSSEYRIPLILKHYYGYTYEEISTMIGIAEGTVKSRVHGALTQIRKELQ
ncbi:RNA polymerase sigma factor SigY [Alkalihalobacillus sp. LMS39]|uniref:RNA polymerase sigma factor SigY n=1 Tax=Alkalihalobacillus sp. LMS39 TaxID=2924032 RepID=UPI001FB3BC1C|nr:RNA polymerase sigma factor SigY [Alkalihalobacillus sp. LMS39]UOE93175.1 RNA polymerase sigma factor SigY [Alkalihalobacillus sp. LMS39]